MIQAYKLDISGQSEATDLRFSWRDVINVTKQTDEKLFGKWLKEAGVLEKVSKNPELLNKPYSGLPIIKWEIESDKRLTILHLLSQLPKENVTTTSSPQAGLIKLDVPFLSQGSDEANLHDTDCGPTCLAMILRAEGINGSPAANAVTINELYLRHLKDILATNNRKKYTTLEQMKTIGINEGLLAGYNQYKSENEAIVGLRKDISESRPVVAVINYAKWSSHVKTNFTGIHFVVVTGFDNSHVFVHDPLFPPSNESTGKFYRWRNELFLAGWGTVDPPSKSPNQNFAYVYTNKIVPRL